jgi:hypothetical protein
MKKILSIAAVSGLAVLYPMLALSQEHVEGLTPEVRQPAHQDVSRMLREVEPQRSKRDERTREVLLRDGHRFWPPQDDPVTQRGSGFGVATTPGLGFDGIGLPAHEVIAMPPDPNGAAGARMTVDGRLIDQYVQWVNVDFAVFDKGTGTIVYGPAAGNTLWNGFGGPCEQFNDGDPIAQYDKAANRWVLTQFAVSGGPPYYQCVAVSTTPDATGPFNRYAFPYTSFPDYPKLGVWPDGYYVSFNMFDGDFFVGARVCAYDRDAMLGNVARPVTQQCFQLSPSFGGLLPSDLDGAIAPPAGSPNFFLALGFNALQLWKFQVDWTTPSNTTLTGPTHIPVAAFSRACNGGVCIPQRGTRTKLDSLGDRLMYRLAYRHFADGHEAVVANHSVNVGKGVAGIRWYELRNANGETMAAAMPDLYQQGTYSPDKTYRWMGSIAMDKVGNIAVGYSVSSKAIHPGIRYTGRAPGDPLGLLGAETSIQAGTGSQTQNRHRWGDYSSMSVDPTDDCTFWYTNQYLKSDGSFNWSTRIASFRFTTCE